MTLTGCRIVKARLADCAFSGDGARLHGGRWNSPGVPVIDLASTTSLAMLEMLVHLQSRELLLEYVMYPVMFDESLVVDVDRHDLPGDWRVSPASPAVQSIGDRWIASGASPVLRVPSAVVESEFNYVLNPAHAGYRDVTIGRMRRIAFAPRLK